MNEIIIKEPMTEWKEYKLGEIGTVITGKTPSARNPEDWGDEILFVTPSDYRNYGKYANNSERKLSNIGAKRLLNKMLPPKSILVTCIGSDMGKVVMSKKNCITNQQINALIPNKQFDNDFLYYSLISIYDTLRIMGGDGTAVPIVNKGDFEKIVLSIPTLDEQRRISSILSSLDDKIDLLHRENATLEQMAETLFRQWFVVEAKEEWEEGTVADLVEFNPTRKLVKGTIAPFLEMSNLSTSTYAPTYWYNRAFSSGSKFQNGDTLLARITPCLENGKTAYVDFLNENQVGWGSTEFIVMHSKLGIHSFFSYVIAKYQDFRDYAESCMSGSSGRQRVDVDNLKNYPINIPDKTAIAYFNSEIDTMVSKMNNNNKQIQTLIQTRNGLLPRLMSGEVKL